MSSLRPSDKPFKVSEINRLFNIETIYYELSVPHPRHVHLT